MKKIFGKTLFVVICIVAFIISVAVSFKITLDVRSAAPYKYLKTDKSGYTVVNNLNSEYDAATYDLYLPSNAEAGRQYGMILFIHGGGFTSGDKSDGARICPYYASKGMIAVSANYSLQSEGQLASLNQMHEELCSIIRSAKAYCAERGFEITEMATTGESAGGYLALLLAYREPEAMPVPVKFAFTISAPTTFEPEAWGLTEDADKVEFVNRFSGASFTKDDIGSEVWQEAINWISPTALVSGESVPTILAYGPKDTVVPTNLKYLLFDAMDAAGAPYVYIEFPNSGHGLQNDPDKSVEYYSLADEYIAKYFETAE